MSRLTTFRDYSVNTQKNTIQICFFIGYLEIHSPSEFYRRMTVEDLGKAKPDLRNPTLATMSEFLLNTENRYSGIPTIRREMKEHDLPEPLFENRRNEFVVTLYNHHHHNKIDLVSFCKTPRTRQEIGKLLGIKTTSFVTKEYIQPLVDAGALFLTNPDKPKSKNQKYYSI